MNIFPDKDPLVENKTLYNIEYNFISIFGKITKALFVVVFLGLFQTTGSNGANQLESIFFYVAFYVKAFIGLFLMYRFNSWREKKIRFTDLDRKACFSAGFFIILLSFYEFFNRYLIELRNIVQPIVKPILQPLVEQLLKTLGLGAPSAPSTPASTTPPTTTTTTPSTTTPSTTTPSTTTPSSSSPNLLLFNKTDYQDPKGPNNIS